MSARAYVTGQHPQGYFVSITPTRVLMHGQRMVRVEVAWTGVQVGHAKRKTVPASKALDTLFDMLPPSLQGCPLVGVGVGMPVR